MKKYPQGGFDRSSINYLLIDFILHNIPYNQHKPIEILGEDNIDVGLLDYYNSDIWFKQEKIGLLYVNKYSWSKAISKNLMLEIFSILKPKSLRKKLPESPRDIYGRMGGRKNSFVYSDNDSGSDGYRDYRREYHPHLEN